MNKEFNIDIPMHLRGITLGQYQQWLKIVDKYDEENGDENYLKVKMLQIFCNLPIEDTYKIPLHNFDNIVDHIGKLFKADTPLVHRWFMESADGTEKVDLGLIPDLHKMSFGEYIDLDKYINDWDNMDKAMAVLFRPVVFQLRDAYNISEYEGTAKLAALMKDMPLDIVLGAINFFLRLTNKLVSLTLDSTHQMATESLQQASKLTLEENGDGINHFILSLKKMQVESMKPLS